MSEIKAVLFDADGVLTLPEEMFSIMYAKSRGLSLEPFEQFFKTEWNDFVTGKRDLKDHIRDNPDVWKWDGTPEELLDYWFTTEDIRNEPMTNLVKEVRKTGMPCYLATEQEKYRGEYMKNVMFQDLFNDYFLTAELGLRKSDPNFFKTIMGLLQKEHPGLKPEEVVFFDDSQSKVDAALTAGLTAYLFESVEQVRGMLFRT